MNSNGMDCDDINECEESSLCGEEKQCTNTDGSYTCDLLYKYRAIAINSTFLDTCILRFKLALYTQHSERLK